MSTESPSDTLGWVVQTYVALDRQYQQLADLYRDNMQCKPGCFGCCSDGFTIRESEWQMLNSHLQTLDAPARQQMQTQLDSVAYQQTHRCPLLINGQCSVYAGRPLVCRGFGVMVETPSGVSTCPLNFNGLAQPDKAATTLAVLPLSPFYDVLNDLSSPAQPPRTIREWLSSSVS